MPGVQHLSAHVPACAVASMAVLPQTRETGSGEALVITGPAQHCITAVLFWGVWAALPCWAGLQLHIRSSCKHSSRSCSCTSEAAASAARVVFLR